MKPEYLNPKINRPGKTGRLQRKKRQKRAAEIRLRTIGRRQVNKPQTGLQQLRNPQQAILLRLNLLPIVAVCFAKI